MENKEIVLNELIRLYHNNGYIFDDICYFVDEYKNESEETEIGKAYHNLSKRDELEVLEEYVKYRKQRRILNG